MDMDRKESPRPQFPEGLNTAVEQAQSQFPESLTKVRLSHVEIPNANILSVDMSRRTFLKGALAGVAAATVLGHGAEKARAQDQGNTEATATLQPTETVSNDSLLEVWNKAAVQANTGAGFAPAPAISFPQLDNPLGHSVVNLSSGEYFPNFSKVSMLQDAPNNGRSSYRFSTQVIYAGYTPVEIDTSDGKMKGVKLHGLTMIGDPRVGEPLKRHIDLALWYMHNDSNFAPYPPVFTLGEIGSEPPRSKFGAGGGGGTPVDDILAQLTPYQDLLEVTVGGAWDYGLDHVALSDEYGMPTDLFDPALLEQNSNQTKALHDSLDSILLDVARAQGYGLKDAGSGATFPIGDEHIYGLVDGTLEERVQATPSSEQSNPTTMTMQEYTMIPLVTEIRGYKLDSLPPLVTP